MEYRYLGNTGLSVPVISLGVMNFNGGKKSEVGSIDQPLAEKLVHEALDLGINLFDTADVYAGGLSEIMLGKALGSRRNEALIATKVGFAMSENPSDAGLSMQHILKGCEDSLRRLNTETIDLYQVHSFDPATPLEETLRAMDKLVQSGKVRFIGCSNFTAWQTMKALSISVQNKLERFVSTQLYYSLGARDIEHEIIPLCLDEQLGVICWSPLSGGFFTGKYRRNEPLPSGGRRSHRQARTLKYWWLDEEKGYDILDVLEPISKEIGKTVAQAALAWLLNNRAVSTVVTGATGIEQLRENASASGIMLSEAMNTVLNQVSAPAIPYPQRYQFESDR